MPLTKEEREAKEREARAASMFKSADPIVMAEIERGAPLSEEEKVRLEQAVREAKSLGVY